MTLLRSYQRTDLERLYQIDQICFPAGISYSKAELRYYLQHPKAYSVVAEDGVHSVVGFCIGHLYLHRDIQYGHIITIDVLPEVRQKGVGRRLLETVEEYFRSADVRSIKLEVSVDNLDAQGFYKRMGYEVAGRIPKYYLGVFDAFAMTKQINGSLPLQP